MDIERDREQPGKRKFSAFRDAGPKSKEPESTSADYKKTTTFAAAPPVAD